MINQLLSMGLPLPWSGQVFETDRIGSINFLVGPNGSGKSQFAQTLFHHINGNMGPARLLGTDRLHTMAKPLRSRGYSIDAYPQGIPRNNFQEIRAAGNAGLGHDAIVILEERMDIRIQVEATLKNLFDREIVLEWDSGNLIPTARRTGEWNSYRLDREECHGIKEILVLLTQLYDDSHKFLVIDEPELNLHPQYQAYFMQEIRKLAGDPLTEAGKKAFFLVTHSPFILDFRSHEDLESVISFDLVYSLPKQISGIDFHNPGARSFVRRLNAHHKQLFFADNPIFVEGIHDAQLIATLMENLGVSVPGAGSCIIDVGGVAEANRYFELCQALGKEAHFVYDLDSLFSGHVRRCIKDDETVQSLLASSGLGNDIAKYCGDLDALLTDVIKRILNNALPSNLNKLGCYLANLDPISGDDPQKWAKARIAVMTTIGLDKQGLATVIPEAVLRDIEGRRDQILNALREKNIHVLPRGTLEAYLPEFSGDLYDPSDVAKRAAFDAELEIMVNLSTEQELFDRYGDLYSIVRNLPSKPGVDVEPVLRKRLGDYIHRLQTTVVTDPDLQRDEIQQSLNRSVPEFARVVSVKEFDRQDGHKFTATIEIAEMLGQPTRVVRVDHTTNAGMQDFQIELENPPSFGIS